ncbi:prophage LambdaBa03, transcriptional regulator domain protein [Bacillus sp. UMTAT18]|uniref:hypothetical protein n=1 Tax=Bacillus TaxID=1386 RepID=UPI0006186C0A|nr:MULTISPECIES: hypothetical protein [unclassified Bacillus (in: firmicutes)]KKC56438.1 prophage LambdaBa03, transcriptional regulator domain protein [Bacillus sp. UMTAT18]OJD77540.1 hypothetical protein BAU29_18645 [Bacillus sp. P14-1]
MKQLTTTYDIKEISKLLNVKEPTFRKNPEKQLDKLRPFYHVEVLEKEHSNSKQFYNLTPKDVNDVPAVVLDSNNEVKVRKNSEEQIELLLKAVLIDEMVPIHTELAKVIGKHENTVGNRVREMKELGIKLPTPIITVEEYDKETGEITEYHKKDCYWYYYDTLPNGDIEKLTDTTEVHRDYGRYVKQKIAFLKSKFGINYDSEKGRGEANKYAKAMLNKEFGFYSINRVAEWNVSKEYATKIFEKYGR